jgi:hypothetical protein
MGALDFLFSKTHPDHPWSPPYIKFMPGLFSEVKRMERGVDHPPHLAPM